MSGCRLCPSRFFNDENALRAHQESKHRSCGTCSRVFKNQQALEQHIRDKHSSFECRYCDRKFTTEQGRDAHEDAKHTDFECNYCTRTFNSDEARQQHENTKHSFGCRHCDRNFNSEEARQQHEDAEHTFQCRHCVCVFFSENAREQHEDDVHSFDCHYCDRNFSSEEARQQHEDAKHTSKCHYCDRKFSSDEARQQHEGTKHPQKSFSQVGALWQHQPATPQFKCDHCGTTHYTSSFKILHEASCAHNPDNQIACPASTLSVQPTSPSSSDPQLAETVVEGSSSSMDAQDTDMESDSPASPSRSSQDEGEMFHSTSTLPSTDATGVEVAFQPPPVCAHSLDPLRCFLCRSSSTSKRDTDDADSIVSITRSDENHRDDSMDCSNVPFQCTPCLKVFETEQALRDHVCAFRTTMPRPHCPVCYTRFDDGVSLHNHLEGLEAFSCRLCLTRCCSDEMLQDHLLSHPTCSKCGKSFADDIARCAHVESEHPVVVCWDCGGIVVDNSLEFHYTECSAHPSCAFCGVGMRDSTEMDEHVRQVHEHVTDAEMNDQPGGGEVDAGSVSPAVPSPETSRPEEVERPPAQDEPAPSSSGVDTLCGPGDDPHGTPLQTESTLYSSPLPSVPPVELVEPAGDTSVGGEEVERQFASPSPTPAEHGSDGSHLFRVSKATITINDDTRPPSPVSSVSASAGSLSDLSSRTSSSASESVVFVSAEGIPDYVRENRAVLVATSAGASSSSSAAAVAAASGRTSFRLSFESSLASLAREVGLGPAPDGAARKARTGEAAYSLHCRICLRDPCENPTATLCGHLFCKRCITRAVVTKSECPVCESATLLYCLFKLDLSV